MACKITRVRQVALSAFSVTTRLFRFLGCVRNKPQCLEAVLKQMLFLLILDSTWMVGGLCSVGWCTVAAARHVSAKCDQSGGRVTALSVREAPKDSTLRHGCATYAAPRTQRSVLLVHLLSMQFWSFADSSRLSLSKGDRKAGAASMRTFVSLTLPRTVSRQSTIDGADPKTSSCKKRNQVREPTWPVRFCLVGLVSSLLNLCRFVVVSLSFRGWFGFVWLGWLAHC